MSRGLESLIPRKNNNNEKETLTKKEDVFWVNIKKVRENPYQPRKVFNEEELDKLANSIRKYGVLQPLIISKIEDENFDFELIAGERRFRACKKLGVDKVPVLIKKPSVQEKLEVALIENVQRANLNPIDKAEAYLILKDEFGLLDKEIAEVAGKSRESITNSLRLLILEEAVKEALRRELITEGHAKVLLGLEKEEQLLFLKYILEEKLSVRALEKKIKEVKNPKTKVDLRQSVNLEEYEKKFKSFFKYDDLKVRNSKKGYQVILNFKDEQGLNNWIDKK